MPSLSGNVKILSIITKEFVLNTSSLIIVADPSSPESLAAGINTQAM